VGVASIIIVIIVVSVTLASASQAATGPWNFSQGSDS
jgi:hypothetical protein